MAFDEELGDRVRDLVAPRSDSAEIRMFGGLCFTIAGNMCCGVINDDLMVRLAPEDAERALAEEGVRAMDFTGKPMKGMIYVGSEVTADDEGLAAWVEEGVAFASSLPPKPKKGKKQQAKATAG
jgi:TfoX/Sxy family transcriptional regulator of competence genes